MKKEVTSAVDFVASILRTKKVEVTDLDSFRQALEVLLCTHYADHWFPEKPFKGSAYRCIRIVNKQMDPIITKAGAQSGLSLESLLNMLPSELTIWVDPKEVSYRIGEDGSIGVLFGDENSPLEPLPKTKAPSPTLKKAPASRSPSVSPPPPVVTRVSPIHHQPTPRFSPTHLHQHPNHLHQQPPHPLHQQQQQHYPHHPHQDHTQGMHHFSQGCGKDSTRFGGVHSSPNDSPMSWEFLSSTFVAS